MMAALAAWAAVVAGFFVWLMLRECLLVWHGVPLAILTLAVLAGAVWGGRVWLQDARCKADGTFYEQLAAAPMERRAALLAQAPRPLDDLTSCGRETIGLFFLADRYAPLPAASQAEAERIATLALLLDRGLPPDDMLFLQAIAAADPDAVGLLIARREALGMEAVPLPFARHALAELDPDPASPYHAQYARYLAMLAAMIEGGLDLCQPGLRDELVRKGVPRELWEDAAKAC